MISWLIIRFFLAHLSASSLILDHRNVFFYILHFQSKKLKATSGKCKIAKHFWRVLILRRILLLVQMFLNFWAFIVEAVTRLAYFFSTCYVFMFVDMIINSENMKRDLLRTPSHVTRRDFPGTIFEKFIIWLAIILNNQNTYLLLEKNNMPCLGAHRCRYKWRSREATISREGL